jgi:hypothetical protein
MKSTSLLNEPKKLLSGDTSIKDYIDSLAKDFVVLPEDYGFSGFALDLVQNRSFELKSNFSNEVIDDGSVITQHRTKEPAIFTMKGYVFDTKIEVALFEQLSTKMQNKVGVVGSYLPAGMTMGAQQKLAQLKGVIAGSLSKVDQIISEGNSLFDATNKEEDTKLTRTYKMIQSCINIFENTVKLKISVFGFPYENMYISNLKIDDEIGIAKGRVEFAITFQQVLVAKQMFSKIDKNKFTKINQHRVSDINKKGQSVGKEIDNKTFLQKLI